MARITGRPELNLSAEQQALVLDLAREAAHGVARPAAPLTTFLAGYALGTEGGLDRLGGSGGGRHPHRASPGGRQLRPAFYQF